MNQKLVELAKQIEDAEKTSVVDLAGWDFRTRPGMETAVRAAKESLPTLRKAFQEVAASGIVKVFLQGSPAKAEKFVEAAKGEKTVFLRGDAVYRKLAEPIDRTLDERSRKFSSTQAVRLVEELTDLARELEIRELPMPKVDANDFDTVAKTLEDTVGIVRSAVRRTMEDDLNKVFLAREALEKVTDAKLTSDAIPVFIGPLEASEVQNLSRSLFPGGKNIVVNLDNIEDDEKFLDNVVAEITTGLSAIGE